MREERRGVRRHGGRASPREGKTTEKRITLTVLQRGRTRGVREETALKKRKNRGGGKKEGG